MRVTVPCGLPDFAMVDLAGWIRLPEDPERTRAVVYCLAGGYGTTAYFDLAVDGRTGYSMASHFAASGVAVLALDHPGVGASSNFDDVSALTPTIVAGCHAEATSQIRAMVMDGTLLADLPGLPDVFFVGLGHSMGGVVIDVVQGRHGAFDAIVGLGHGSDGLPAALTPDELALADRPLSDIETPAVEFARAREAGRTRRAGSELDMDQMFHLADVPEDVRRAHATSGTRLLQTCGLISMIPGSTDEEKRLIDTPVFLGFGDADIVPGTADDVARYSSSRDITLFHLPGSSHLHNQAGTRSQLWDRILRWLPA